MTFEESNKNLGIAITLKKRKQEEQVKKEIISADFFKPSKN